MGKYLLLWEIDQSKVPISATERGTGWSLLIAMVKQDLQKGAMKDWGAFVGELNGYTVVEGSEVEIGNLIQQYVPFVSFETHPVASVGQVDQIIQGLSK